VPESVVGKHGEIPLFRKLFKRFFFQIAMFIGSEIVEEFSFENKKAPVNILIEQGFLLPGENPALPIGRNGPKPGRHPNAGKRSDRVCLPVKV